MAEDALESSIAGLDQGPEIPKQIVASREVTTQDKNRTDRRSRIETLVDILRVIDVGFEKPTHIMYKANLSWTMMQTCVSTLLAKHLIVDVQEDGRKHYRLTEKGKRVIREFQSVKENLDLISETIE